MAPLFKYTRDVSKKKLIKFVPGIPRIFSVRTGTISRRKQGRERPILAS